MICFVYIYIYIYASNDENCTPYYLTTGKYIVQYICTYYCTIYSITMYSVHSDLCSFKCTVYVLLRILYCVFRCGMV